MDRLLSMEIFVQAIELGTFTAVAEKFRLSPPMVSKHIRELEKRLGASLINRTTRQQHLTEIGEAYYHTCKEILEQISTLETLTTANSNEPKGKLKVSASVWYGMSTLAPVIAEYLAAYPDIDIELILNDRYVDPVSEGYDVVIRIGQLEDSSLVARKLPDYELKICASPLYIKKYGLPTDPQELTQHQCLYFTSWLTQGGWRQINSTVGRHISPRLTSNNVQVIRQAAINGIGLILMPNSLLHEDLKTGRLVEIMEQYKPTPKPVHLLFSEKAKNTAKIYSFVEFVSHSLNQH